MCVLNHNKPVWCLASPESYTTLKKSAQGEPYTMFYI